MANDASVIREFLVQLGFSLDSTSQKKFTDGISLADKAVLGITASLAGFTAALLATTNGMERLYFASQRTQASVAGIKSFQYAITNLGGSAEDALGSIEGIAKFIRSNPGGEGFIGALGVGTRNSAGQLRDTVDILSDLGKQFAAMPYYQASKRASLLGIDEKTLQALIKGVGQFSDEYRKMSQDIGFDSDKAAGTSHAFMVQLRGLRGELGLLSDKFFATFAEQLTPVVERARKWIEANAGLIALWIDRIVNVLGVLAKIVSTVVTRTVEIFNRLIGVFDRLSPETQTLIEAILGLAAAWKLLSIAMAASPLGIVLALASALLLLYDDYETWKEGGQSLIDWDKWEPGITAATKAIRELVHWIDEAVQAASRLSDSPSFQNIVAGAQQIGRVIAATVGNDTAQKELDQQSWAKLGASGQAVWKARWAGYSDDQKNALRSDHPEFARLIEGGSGTASATSSGGGGGVRGNNPGNIRDASGTGFASYATPAAGLAQLGHQLNLYATGKSRNTGGRSLDTLQDIISTYAPPSENNTSAYIADVSQRMGVKPTDRLNLSDPDTLASLMRGITIHEQGRNPYSNQQFRDAASTTLGGAATISQETTINVNGAGNPSEVANRTATAQNVVNQRLARNLSTAAQ
jgi:hypothetical protein